MSDRTRFAKKRVGQGVPMLYENTREHFRDALYQAIPDLGFEVEDLVPATEVLSVAIGIINNSKVKVAIRLLPSGRPVSEDEIPPELLKHGEQLLESILKRILDACCSTSGAPRIGHGE